MKRNRESLTSRGDPFTSERLLKVVDKLRVSDDDKILLSSLVEEYKDKPYFLASVNSISLGKSVRELEYFHRLSRRRYSLIIRDAIMESVSLSAAESLALRDPVMQIDNRRALDEYLLALFKPIPPEVKREIIRLCHVLFFFDINKFKQFNDKYGHGVGDYVMESVAQIVRNQFSSVLDKVARWGSGDEIVAVLYNADYERSDPRKISAKRIKDVEEKVRLEAHRMVAKRIGNNPNIADEIAVTGGSLILYHPDITVKNPDELKNKVLNRLSHKMTMNKPQNSRRLEV